MYKSDKTIGGMIRWIVTSVGVIYVIVFLFCLTCVDLKTLDTRIKVRHLNDAIPDFSGMIIFSQNPDTKRELNWRPYKDYFELILSYTPNDVIIKQLLGFVDFYSGQEQQAIDLFKSSSVMDGHDLFWSDYNLGVLYYKKKLWPLATKYLFKAAASGPGLTALLMQNSLVYKQIFSSPFFKYSLNDGLHDAQSKSYILLLSSLFHMGLYDKVIIVSNLAIEGRNLSYKDAFYYYSGLAFYQIGQPQKALLFFQKSLAVEKNNPDVYYYIAHIYLNAGQLQQAQYFLQTSYDLHLKNDGRFPYDKQINLRFF